MADLSSITLPDGNTYNFKDGRVSLPLPITSGGTGAATASDAIYNLGAVDLTSDQVIGGYKEFSEYITVRSYIEFKSNASTDNGSIWITNGSKGPQFYMYVYRTGAQDLYYLPRITNTESGSHTYLILSEKAPVTIAQGGTGATTAANAIYNLGAMPAILEEYEGVGRITCEYSDNNGSLQFYFEQYTSDSSLGHEYYLLPENTNDDIAEDQYYNIITTKDGSSYFVDLTNNQNISGTKTFLTYLQIKMSATPGIKFLNSNGTVIGMVYEGGGTTNGIYHGNRLQIQTKSYNSTTGEILSHYEQYALPPVTADKTTDDQHYIWTSKQGGTSYRPVYISGSDDIVAIRNENSDLIGELYWSGAKTNNVTHGRWYLGHYSYNGTTGARLSTYEGYYLPSITADLATSATYEIWTSKENTTTNNSTETVVKLKNGIQIIVGKTTKKVTSMTQVGSGGIYCCAITMSWTTTPWYDTNYEVSGSTRYSTGHIMPFGMIPSTTTSSTGYLYDGANRSNVTYNVWYHAVGRWK